MGYAILFLLAAFLLGGWGWLLGTHPLIMVPLIMYAAVRLAFKLNNKRILDHERQTQV